MVAVKTGIDGMNLTFGTSTNYDGVCSFRIDDISSLFPGITSNMFHAEASPFAWYRDCLTLKSTRNTSLMKYHYNCLSQYGKRNLLQINGLCFSDSAWNPLRPLNLGELFSNALMYDVNVSKFDGY